MVRDSLIRRLRLFAQRYGWDGAAVALFAVALVAGSASLLSGAGKFVDALVPGTTALASDDPAHAGPGRAHLPMFEFAAATHYSPQVLFPVTSHGLPDWLQEHVALARPAAPAAHPVIAICIDDLGEDIAGTDRAMALPKQVALSFLPYADTTPFLAQEAKQMGHVVLAHVPMQAISRTSPGAMALTLDAPDITARLLWNIAHVPGLSGINNHEGSRFTQDADALAPVVQVLAAKHLFFFDSRTIPDSMVVSVSRRFGVMSAGRDIFLDDTISEAEVRAQLAALVATAKRQGVAIAIGHPHNVTLTILAEWLAQDHGVELVTLPDAMQRKMKMTALASR